MKTTNIAILVLLFAACLASGCGKKPDKVEKTVTPVDTTLTTEPNPSGLISDFAKQTNDCTKGDGLSQSDSLAACSAAGVTSMKLEFVGYCQAFNQATHKTEFLKCSVISESGSAPKETQDLMLEWAGPAAVCGADAPTGCRDTTDAEKVLFGKGWCRVMDDVQFPQAYPDWRKCLPTDTFYDPYEQEDGNVPGAQDTEAVSSE